MRGGSSRTSVEAGRPVQRDRSVRGVGRPQVERRVGVREDGQPVHRRRPAQRVRRRARVIAVVQLVHLQYRQRRLVKRFVHLFFVRQNTCVVRISVRGRGTRLGVVHKPYYATTAGARRPAVTGSLRPRLGALCDRQGQVMSG